MKKIPMICRYALGVIFTVFGFAGVLMSFGINLMPEPEMSLKMQMVFKGFEALGYLMPLVKIIETAAGILLLTNRYVNLALVSLLPIVINILGIHLFVDQAGLPIAILVSVLLAVLLIDRQKEFKAIFKP